MSATLVAYPSVTHVRMLFFLIRHTRSLRGLFEGRRYLVLSIRLILIAFKAPH
jgi:hypothetical protein